MTDRDRRPKPTLGLRAASVRFREIEDLHGRSADAFTGASADAMTAARRAMPALATV